MTEPTISGYTSLKLRDFTCFHEASFDFVPGVNVFVGENGTGKTHVMKVLYSALLLQALVQRDGFIPSLLRVMPAESQGELVSHNSTDGKAQLRLRHSHFHHEDSLYHTPPKPNGYVMNTWIGSQPNRPVFIPATDMMGHTRKFTNIYDEYNIDFDYTYRDIAHLLEIEKRTPSPEYLELLDKLEYEVLKGTVEYDSQSDRFFLVQNGNRQPMPLVAEGLRKIATLLVLVRNGSIKSGTSLFWDEPEVNLNPVLMDEVVGANLALARSGVQVFLATHSYVMLEELHDQSAPGEVRYFGFDPKPSGVEVRFTESLPDLQPNAILRQYESLFNRKVARAFGSDAAG